MSEYINHLKSQGYTSLRDQFYAEQASSYPSLVRKSSKDEQALAQVVDRSDELNTTGEEPEIEETRETQMQNKEQKEEEEKEEEEKEEGDIILLNSDHPKPPASKLPITISIKPPSHETSSTNPKTPISPKTIPSFSTPSTAGSLLPSKQLPGRGLNLT